VAAAGERLRQAAGSSHLRSRLAQRRHEAWAATWRAR
jgi:hypothetical protein